MIVVSHSKNIIVMRLQAVCGVFQDPIRPNFNYNQLLNQFRASLLLKVYSLKNSNPQRRFVFNEVKIKNKQCDSKS